MQTTSTKNIHTTTRLPHPVNVVYQQQALDVLRPDLLYSLFADSVGMPKNAGTDVAWSRWSKLAAQVVPLSETGDPTPLLQSRTDIKATVQAYGFMLGLSKLLKMTGLGQEQQKKTDEIIECRNLSIDTLNRNCLVGGASVTTCSNSTDGTATHINVTDIDAVVQTLLNNDCKPPLPIISAGAGQGTSPIEEAYPVIANTKIWTTLKKVSGFIPVAEYPSRDGILPGEVGAVGKTRWCLTTNGYYDGSSYYYATFITRGAYGNVSITGSKEPLIAKDDGAIINPTTYFGTYYTYAAKILDELRLHNLRFTV